MKTLVLGSNSFAGACFVNHLLNNEKTVIGVSRSKEPNPILLAYQNNANKTLFQFYQFDINKQINEIFKLISQQKPNIIVDFAGQGMVAESWSAPDQWYQTNIVAKAQLHHFLSQCDFIEKYIRVSTPEVYGSTEKDIDENCHYKPSTPYAVSHAAIDLSLKAYYQQYQFPVVFTRFANFYGPYQQLYRIIPRTIIYGLTGKKLSLHGGGTSQRAFIYGDDVAVALNSVIENGKIGETYHFSSEKPLSIARLVEIICKKMDIEFSVLVQSTVDRPGKDAMYAMSSEKAARFLGWKPKISLEIGIAHTIDWVRSNIEAIKSLPLEYIHKK
ncbi:MAG: dTDP-glucose 4,6-dehydratase [Gammaproteobacteria bacterium RIFCSPHIGHO2_12_FULL_37_14]|nr:MAG: dTDP-glucose 4,6-dehydratase [Gammaproteobacteria bacterium RIFCSPHIGHO2_12_FULL_37_14]